MTSGTTSQKRSANPQDGERCKAPHASIHKQVSAYGTASGRRVYDARAITRLRFVRRCRNLGFPIPDIRALLDLAQTSEAPCPATVALGRRHLAEVRRKVDQLAGIERALADMLDRCHGDDGACAFLDELFDEVEPPLA